MSKTKIFSYTLAPVVFALLATPAFAATISGTVTDPDPVNGASVAVTCFRTVLGIPVPTVKNTTTNSFGFYTTSFTSTQCPNGGAAAAVATEGMRAGSTNGTMNSAGNLTLNIVLPSPTPTPTNTPTPSPEPTSTPTPTQVPPTMTPTPTDEPTPTPTPEEPPVIPEFGVVQAALAMLGSAGTYIALRRRSV